MKMNTPNLELFNKYWQLLEQYKNDEVQMGYFADKLIKNKPSLAEHRRKIILFLQKIDYVDPLFNGEIGQGKLEVDGVTCCWSWNAGKFSNGYGQFWVNNLITSTGAHRFMLDIVALDFDINSELEACHECDNPPCVNPNHLRPATHQYNMDDRDNKNRQATGINIGNAKLTDDQVWAIYYDERIQEVIAAEYGVSQVIISNIKRGDRKLTDQSKSLPKNQNIRSLQAKTGLHGKVTKEMIEEVKKLYATDKYTQKELGIIFGVSEATINNILKGKNLKRFGL